MSNQYSVLIKDAMIVDGTGQPAFTGNLGVRGEKLVHVGDAFGEATREIDGAGLVACPGFVDPHSHADLSVLAHPDADNLIMQGITTFVGGNCALSLAPVGQPEAASELLAAWGFDTDSDWRTFGEWLSKVEQVGIAPNYVPLVGHHAVRASVMGMDLERQATPGEIEEMQGFVAEAMESGALGLSTFADPGPGELASMEEVIELAKVAGQYGGLYVPHTRHVQSQWPSDDLGEHGYGIYHGPIEDVWVGKYRGYLEAIEVSRKARVPLHIAHLGVAYHLPQPHPDYLDEAAARATLEIIDEAIADGIDVTFDVIACDLGIGGQHRLLSAFSKWMDESGEAGLVERLRTPAFREEYRGVYESGRLKFGMVHTRADPYWMDCFKIVRCDNEAYQGKTITWIAADRSADPVDTVLDILIEYPDTTWAQFVDKRGPRAAISTFLQHPAGMACSDTIYVLPTKPPSDTKLTKYGLSPIMYGLYPHFIGTYVRDEGILSLEDAIMKATSTPARRFGLRDRGLLRPGTYADIVLFDLERIDMTGDFDNPAQAPEGIEWVLINGQVVYDGTARADARPGKVLKRHAGR